MMNFKQYNLTLFSLILFVSVICGQTGEVYSVERAPFSSRSYDEYAPVLYQDGIVFSANRRMDVLRRFDGEKGKPPLNIFISREQADGKWTEPGIFSEDLRTITYDGPATFNAQGDQVYFNRNYEPGNRKARSNVGIFSAQLLNGKWTDIQPFPHNNPAYNFFHPTLSKDGKKLFFTSDMPGGSGGFDLYVSTLERGNWSTPVNLGPVVNSRKNEIYPVIHDNGRLFFSSNGFGGIGGYDILFSIEINGEWIPPVNPGEPFNSRRNDACLLSDTTYTSGYITSNRDRFTNSIYKFSLTAPAFDSCGFQKRNNYCFTFFETGAMDIDTTNFMYEWKIGNEANIRAKEASYCFKGSGDYIVQLNVIDLLTGDVMFNEATYELNIEDVEQAYITCPDTILVNEAVHFSGAKTYIKKFQVEYFYWDMGDYTRISDSTLAHSYYRPGIYTIQLGVTDAANRPEGIQKSCSLKRIVVLPRSPLARREN